MDDPAAESEVYGVPTQSGARGDQPCLPQWRRARAPLLGAALLAAGACGDGRQEAPAAAPEEGSATAPVAAAETGATRIVFLGDSLTAGFGIDQDQAFPALVGAALTAAGYTVRIVNAGVSGDTTAGGLARLDWILRQRPEILVVGLGANDGLRGLSVEMTEDNLRRILSRARGSGAEPLLLGMRLPPNLGPDYVQRFEEIYPRLARELDVSLLPFLLDGVAAVAELNLPDGIHPNAEGHRRVAAHVLPVLERNLAALE